jgi:pyrroloquinoline-quinone synthase
MGIQVAVPETSLRVLSVEEFSARLESLGEERYHHRHPFHLRMHEGRLTPGQLQAWVLNRYYYQSRVPMKDAIILSRSDDLDFRRAWRKRLLDQDGREGAGGLECWLKLAEATGLTRERVTSCRELLPGVRYAVDAYLALVERGTFVEAVASSLTELFATRLIAVRLDSVRRHYAWLSHALGYFEARLSQAPEDAQFAFRWVYQHARTRDEQELAVRAVTRKCDLLWAQLDALYFAYVEPGWPPPGAFRPEQN